MASSDDASTHGGQQLYYIFARVRLAYLDAYVQDEAFEDPLMKALIQSQPGQAIVLESWTSEKADSHIEDISTLTSDDWDLAETHEVEDTEGTFPLVQRDGETYYAAEKSGLFMMLRADEDNPYELEHSTGGWIFARTTPDGSTITELGKVQSCIECHQNAPYRGGLFGLQAFDFED